MSDENLQHAILKDPLSEQTRKERTYLLAVSALGIFMVKTGFLPTKISALGIEFTETNRSTLLKVIAAIIIYFLLAFILYSLSDYWSYRINVYLSQIKSLFSRADSLFAYRDELKNFRSEADRIKEGLTQFHHEGAQVKELVKEKTEEAEKKVEELKNLVKTNPSLALEEKTKELDKIETLKNELEKRQSEFKERKAEFSRDIDILQATTKVLGIKNDINESEILIGSARIVAISRLIFEYLLPLLLGGYAIYTLFS